MTNFYNSYRIITLILNTKHFGSLKNKILNNNHILQTKKNLNLKHVDHYHVTLLMAAGKEHMALCTGMDKKPAKAMPYESDCTTIDMANC